MKLVHPSITKFPSHPNETSSPLPTKNPQRITFWPCHISPSQPRAATWRCAAAPVLLALSTGFGATSILAVLSRITQQERVKIAAAASSSNGGLHDLVVSSGGAGQGPGPAVPRPPRLLLRRRLRHRQEDQDRQALRDWGWPDRRQRCLREEGQGQGRVPVRRQVRRQRRRIQPNLQGGGLVSHR